ncbi:MAG: 50S ribosomal protein L17 [Candidatus Marinimicrobia bacterium]|nr:50S ribosomal protein L17 [Candidatus Neomarinimicrobiota bacterium]
MRHQKRVAKLGRSRSHRKALMDNLAICMIEHGKIKTTDAKAKALRSYVEKLITLGKKDSLHARREAYKVLQNRDLVHRLFTHIAPQYIDRPGGYTRIIKLGFRKNDSAPVSLIEFVDYKQPEQA